MVFPQGLAYYLFELEKQQNVMLQIEKADQMRESLMKTLVLLKYTQKVRKIDANPEKMSRQIQSLQAENERLKHQNLTQKASFERKVNSLQKQLQGLRNKDSDKKIAETSISDKSWNLLEDSEYSLEALKRENLKISSKISKEPSGKKKVKLSRRLLDTVDDDENAEANFLFTQLTSVTSNRINNVKTDKSQLGKIKLMDKLGEISPIKKRSTSFDIT